jgi:hypothetical protein
MSAVDAGFVIGGVGTWLVASSAKDRVMLARARMQARRELVKDQRSIERHERGMAALETPGIGLR